MHDYHNNTLEIKEKTDRQMSFIQPVLPFLRDVLYAYTHVVSDHHSRENYLL
jgi:hypothetical protein